jgi:hypothetical protein
VLIHSIATLPLSSASLTDAIDQIGLYARQHLVAGDRSQLSIALSERGARIQRALASVLPPGTSGFYTGRAPASSPVTAAQFLEAIAHRAAKDAHCDIRLDCSDISDALRVLDALTGVVPANGRGVTLLLTLDGWRLIDMIDLPVTLTLSRHRIGNRKPAASLAIRFHALSLKDPVVKSTIASAARVAGVRFGKRFAALASGANDPLDSSSVPPADSRLRPAAPQAQLVVRQTFDEALARAAESLNADPGDLVNLPLLFSRSGGFDKRIHDVRSGKHERINFGARLKLFMREQFPVYRADAADAEQIWFRYSVAPTLDLLLMFDKVHQWGLGKTFSIDFGVDFPGTPLGGMHATPGGTRRNIFWLFHEHWEGRVWAYTTSAELATSLASCGSLLRRLLPVLEHQCRALLLPIPSALPRDVAQRGPLSARDAYRAILPLVHTWAADAELESLGSFDAMDAGAGRGAVEASLSDDGRLRPSGEWSFRFLSKQLDRTGQFTVPHTGRVWWSSCPVLQGAIPKYTTTIAVDAPWIDSTEIAPRAFRIVREHLDGCDRQVMWLSLRDPSRYSGDIEWMAHGIASCRETRSRRDISVRLDRRTGELLDIESEAQLKGLNP